MRKRIAALSAAAASLVAVTLSASPAQATNTTDVGVVFYSNISPYCLDIPNSNAVIGQQLQAWSCNGTGAQHWNVIYTDSYHFKLQSVLNTSLCANNWQGGDVRGNDIKLYNCNSNDSIWNAVHKGDKTQIQPKVSLNTCLSISGGLSPGRPAKLDTCQDISTQNLIISGV